MGVEILERVSPGGSSRRRWSTSEYHKMVGAGILEPHDRVELIYGEVINLAPVGPEHSFVTNNMIDCLRDCLGREFSAFHETPITLADGTEPQPDLSVARGPMVQYRDHHPDATDLLLVIEVSDSTLGDDRKYKLPMYAQFGIREVWIVNVKAGLVETFRNPSNSSYTETMVYGPADFVQLSFAPGKAISVSDIVPPRQ
jgi:Uma2 family endonuclease